MKVLLQSCRLGTTMGTAAALRHLGHEVRIWIGGEPAFDVCDEFRPNIFVRTRPMGRALVRRLRENSHIAIVDREGGLIPAFDSLRFKAGEARDELACDVCFFGSYRPEEQAMIDGYLRPVLDSGLKVKLFGPDPMPYPQYLGTISDRTMCDLYASALVCLDISREPWSERMCTIMGLGGIIATSTRERGFCALIDQWMDSIRMGLGLFGFQKYIATKLNMDAVTQHHTYLIRAEEILKEAVYGKS